MFRQSYFSRSRSQPHRTTQRTIQRTPQRPAINRNISTQLPLVKSMKRSILPFLIIAAGLGTYIYYSSSTAQASSTKPAPAVPGSSTVFAQTLPRKNGTGDDHPSPVEPLEKEVYVFPRDKIAESKQTKKEAIVLISCGSFSPVTVMHLRLFEMAKDYFNEHGYEVVGGYFSPVGDSYGKTGLVSKEHRVNMLKLATETSSWLMVDSWEAMQPTWTPTLQVLEHFNEELNRKSDSATEQRHLRVIMVCGSDLLESFNKPGLWDDKDIKNICKFGIGVLMREGADPAKTIWNNDLLYYRRKNVHTIYQWIPNDISSTRIRLAISRNLSVKYLIPDSVLDYIHSNKLYRNETTELNQDD